MNQFDHNRRFFKLTPHAGMREGWFPNLKKATAWGDDLAKVKKINELNEKW